MLITEFLKTPETQTVNIGSDATFECQFPSALSIGWLFGGVGVNQIRESAMDFTQDNYRESDSGLLVYTLTVLARPEYNGTAIVCAAASFTQPPQNSTPAILIIEGLLI